MRPRHAHLLSIGLAVPSHRVEQADIVARARQRIGRLVPDFERLVPVFDNAGIETRYTVRPPEWYEREHGWADRTEVYLEAATELFVAAAQRALGRAGLAGSDIDTVVTVSSTGVAAPSLEARAAAELGFGPHVARVPVFGLGCAGGVTGLALAARLAEARPGTTVLLVAVEVCSLAIRIDRLTTADIVALALFGDGAAAAVVRADDTGLARLGAGAEHTWPGTLAIMGWTVDPQGFGVVFDRSIPPFARDRFAPAIDAVLARQGFMRADIGRFVCHPGGAKVVEAIEGALSLGRGALDHERAVLAAYGNMSAPTAIFVLDRVIAAGWPARIELVALGPGFTLSGLALARPNA